MYKHLWDSSPGLSVRFSKGKCNIVGYIKFTNANVISRSDCTGILLTPAMFWLRWFLVGISIDICHVWGGSHNDSRLLLSTRPLRPLDFCVTSLNKLTFVLKENTPCSLSFFDSVCRRTTDRSTSQAHSNFSQLIQSWQKWQYWHQRI